MKYPPQKILNLARQMAGLRMAYPNAESFIRRGLLTWRGAIQPMALARTYQMELQYRIPQQPTIRILDPNLHILAEGRYIEHLYSQEDQELCIYYPNGIEWNAAKPLARTVVLWAHEWLVHFETWLFTGHWDGGGTHPRRKTKRSQSTVVAPLL